MYWKQYVITILFGLFFVHLFPISVQQELLAFENCDVISCPLDCNVTFINGEECPLCSCPMGQRCPLLSCPPAPTCTTVQRLDGCLTCSCSLATYELFDEPKNRLIVSTSLSDIPGGAETCNLYDTQSVQRCMKNMLNFMKLAELRNANVIVQPLYSMFLYRQEQIGEMCDNYNQSIRCISTDTLARCKNKERHLHMMMSMFQPICEAMNEQFMKQYDCINNILNSHYQADSCSKVLSRTIDKAIAGPFSMNVKREKKCQSLNSFISCVSPVLKLYCGRNSSEVFKNSLLTAKDTIAPECSVTQNEFEAKKVVEVTLAATTTTPRVGIVFTSPPSINNASSGSSLTLAPLRDPLPPPLQLETGDLLRKRCDFIPVRSRCPNDIKPQAVARWFRRPGATECQTYQYMYCGIELESVDRPIKYRDECNDLCFNEDEKLLRKKTRLGGN